MLMSYFNQFTHTELMQAVLKIIYVKRVLRLCSTRADLARQLRHFFTSLFSIRQRDTSKFYMGLLFFIKGCDSQRVLHIQHMHQALESVHSDFVDEQMHIHDSCTRT